MSEFTDFHAILTEAESIQALRGALEQVVEGAHVPLGELEDGDALMETDTMVAAWANHPKPAWIKLGIVGDIAGLAQLGPAVRIRVEEDFTSWALDARCGDVAVSFAFLATPDRYRGYTENVPLFESSMDVAPLAKCLGVGEAALRATFEPNGGEAFCDLLGITYEQMLDMQLDDIEAGTVSFGYLWL